MAFFSALRNFWKNVKLQKTCICAVDVHVSFSETHQFAYSCSLSVLRQPLIILAELFENKLRASRHTPLNTSAYISLKGKYILLQNHSVVNK